jgi:hypothetical protein
MRDDSARNNLDRHPNHILAAFNSPPCQGIDLADERMSDLAGSC